jgi:hypothetical protein
MYYRRGCKRQRFAFVLRPGVRPPDNFTDYSTTVTMFMSRRETRNPVEYPTSGADPRSLSPQEFHAKKSTFHRRAAV